MTRPELIRRLEFETMLLTRRILDYDSRRGDRDLDRSGYLVLSRIRIQGPMSIGELSAAFALDRSTLHRQTAALSKCGLAERIPDPDGGIARKFRITARGACVLDHERARKLAALRDVLIDWSPEDIDRLAAYLYEFNSGIERLSSEPWPRPGSDRTRDTFGCIG
ncbi:MarR family winged helix-turn-helix transcriptional regulator [Nocardia sp. NBC_01377]|uniref:MarR family winged helix-turn-helix transcriptional regulator n=1 Tax=Nocardia sp. NBC_01377 TaxID=2903595 RepID=UPI0032431CAF